MKRAEQKKKLKSESFDLLVIGGGATGAGVALDAASRGLKVALVEAEDFAAETSSRSTKLIHGGVRYLEQAFTQLDWKQYELVRDALQERSILLSLAPHLCHPLPLLTPIYRLLDVPYYTSGLKLYDRISGKRRLGPSRFVGPKEALKIMPLLEKKNLRGAVIYFDGQFNDARMNVSIALTAVEKGAVVCNHVEVTSLIKSKEHLSGAEVHDRLSGEKWSIKAKMVVNATGPFCDTIRLLDNPKAKKIVSTSSGAHLVVSGEFCPRDMGVLVPKTDDNRVLFLLPWEGHTLVGTTDSPSKLEDNPHPTAQDLDYILKHVNKYFSLKLTKKHILSSWAGLRPLVAQSSESDTAKLSRDHLIEVTDSRLVSIVGGKWTTYRLMAKETVDKVIEVGKFNGVKDSKTHELPLVGAEEPKEKNWKRLAQKCSISEASARHLCYYYGSKAEAVCAEGKGNVLLVPGHPFLECEVGYACREEGACTVVDVLARRLRLAFLDAKAAAAAIPRVAELMKEELGWADSQTVAEKKQALKYFRMVSK